MNELFITYIINGKAAPLRLVTYGSLEIKVLKIIICINAVVFKSSTVVLEICASIIIHVHIYVC